MAGVLLLEYWAPAPFLISGGAALTLLGAFWWMRMGNGKQIARARGPASSPLKYLPRFLAQPRLVTGWLFAVIRSSGWWIYVVYLPIFAIENGIGRGTGWRHALRHQRRTVRRATCCSAVIQHNGRSAIAVQTGFA